MKISSEVNNKKMMINKLEKFFKSKKSSKKIQAKLKYTGLKILNSTYKEIRFIIR
jgi:DNA polymerase III delta prime subunit